MHGLAVEQAKIEDQVFSKYGKDFKLFLKACQHYGLIRVGSRTQLARDALVIGNNLGLDKLGDNDQDFNGFEK